MATPSIAPELTPPSRGARVRGFRPRLGGEIHTRAPGELGWRTAPSTDSQQPRCRPHQRSCRARDVPGEGNGDEPARGRDYRSARTARRRKLPEGATCHTRDLPDNAELPREGASRTRTTRPDRTTRPAEQREPTNGAECGTRRQHRFQRLSAFFRTHQFAVWPFRIWRALRQFAPFWQFAPLGSS